MTLQQQFEETLKKVKDGNVNKTPGQTEKLQLYAWYKQATEGDVHGDAPKGFDIVAKAKYAAWEKVKGMSKDEAMQKYIAFFAE